MNILRSESTGSIHVTSKSPNTPPAVRFNFLTAQLDRDVTLEAMRITRRIMTAPAMRGIATDEIAPGVNIQSDDELLDWVKKNAETTYHPVGTCKMGSDPMAVVDDQLRVHGMEGLRVADASIMPTLTSGNTNAPSIMIGEKASRMMLAAELERCAQWSLVKANSPPSIGRSYPSRIGQIPVQPCIFGHKWSERSVWRMRR